MNLKAVSPYLYLLFRVIAGFMFFLHGGQKIFGWFGGSPMEIFSLIGLAGIMELVIGGLVFLGLFTRVMAGFGAIEMIVAYFMVHMPKGWNPLLNGGELALMYAVAFFVLFVYGSGIWNLEKTFFGRNL